MDGNSVTPTATRRTTGRKRTRRRRRNAAAVTAVATQEEKSAMNVDQNEATGDGLRGEEVRDKKGRKRYRRKGPRRRRFGGEAAKMADKIRYDVIYC